VWKHSSGGIFVPCGVHQRTLVSAAATHERRRYPTSLPRGYETARGFMRRTPPETNARRRRAQRERRSGCARAHLARGGRGAHIRPTQWVAADQRPEGLARSGQTADLDAGVRAARSPVDLRAGSDRTRSSRTDPRCPRASSGTGCRGTRSAYLGSRRREDRLRAIDVPRCRKLSDLPATHPDQQRR